MSPTASTEKIRRAVGVGGPEARMLQALLYASPRPLSMATLRHESWTAQAGDSAVEQYLSRLRTALADVGFKGAIANTPKEGLSIGPDTAVKIATFVDGWS